MPRRVLVVDDEMQIREILRGEHSRYAAHPRLTPGDVDADPVEE